MQRNTRLPVEVTEIILLYVYEDLGKTPPHLVNTADRSHTNYASLTWLLGLRLLGRDWADLIMTYIFRELDLRWSFLASNLLKRQNQSFVFRGMQHLRRLSIGHVFYSNPNLVYSNYLGVELELQPYHYPSSVIYMHDIERILELCIHNLTELKLGFVGSVGFSEAVVETAKRASNLKVLILGSTLARRHDNGSESIHARRIKHDYDSLIALLNEVPSLESLSLNFLSLFSLHVTPGSLPNLQHLFFLSDESNTHAVVNFCRLYAQKLKYLEFSSSNDREAAGLVVFSIWNSIEVLSVDAFPCRTPETLFAYKFCRLRVLRCTSSHIPTTKLEWLQCPFFSTIEIFITNYASSKKNWEDILAGIQQNPTIRPASLKHIIFITSSKSALQDRDLVQAFQAQNLTCHFRGGMTYADVLEANVWVKNQIARLTY
ncbi:uncharacterized protein MELLADRAFT_86003 [Melampsora larici-populina 98AG31]|uniref:F-box domain-containing protein n=1 Tax=Melampsora larici-populina (strain 98AG31 / pathotype 3-4-7) TaxID=747676 RepID=F4RKF4_MELLP|nr:uncharacterized protein MELLADRAFT_86003 [Melampsora larici-populina 98AG31]EGG07086.1 hypothetical protein MELLADRAFT_86003 [Melampsora larici-populina 98AG31]